MVQQQNGVPPPGTAPSDAPQTPVNGNGPSSAASTTTTTTPLWEVSRALSDKLDAFLAEKLEDTTLQKVQAQTRVALEVIGEALRRFRPDQISLSYNGGKDCLVLTILVLASLSRNKSLSPVATFPAVYVVSPHPFTEVDDFVESSSKEYHLSISQYHAPMREALEAYQKEYPKIEAVFVGTRRTDPFCEKLKHFDPTDAGWPSFMRVHPVIDWHYAEIWGFIRHLAIPYISLYDQGYTSLGGRLNTHPNPLLKKEGEEGYRPAYELIDDNVERLGRN